MRTNEIQNEIDEIKNRKKILSETTRSFGDNTGSGKMVLIDGDRDQSNILEYMVEFKSRSKINLKHDQRR